MRGDGIIPVMDVGNNNGNGFGDSYGGSGAWFIILFLIFAVFGWGRNGFGGNGNNGNGGSSNVTYVPYGLGCGGIGNAYTDATIQRGFDNQAVINKLNGLENGLCDGFYAVNNTLCQGFAGVNQNIMQNGYESRLATQGLSSQLANCCCDLRQQLADCLNRFFIAVKNHLHKVNTVGSLT